MLKNLEFGNILFNGLAIFLIILMECIPREDRVCFWAEIIVRFLEVYIDIVFSASANVQVLNKSRPFSPSQINRYAHCTFSDFSLRGPSNISFAWLLNLIYASLRLSDSQFNSV